MAVLDDDTKQTERAELKTIDINNTSLLEGEEQEINPNADAWDQPAPPPDGVYLCKVFLAKQGFQVGMLDDESLTKEQRTFYRANLVLKILDEGKWKDLNIFYNVSTFISAGKEISTMLGMIRKTGVEIKDKKVTPLAQVKLLGKVIKLEPKLYFKGEWKAWDQDKEEWIKVGMKNFPKTEDGKGFSHIVRNSKGAPVTAKFKVDRVFGLKEYREQLEREAKVKQGLKPGATGAQNKAGAAGATASGGSKKKEVEVVEGNFETINNTSASVGDEELVLDE